MEAKEIKLLVYVDGKPEDFLSDAEYLAKYHPELLASTGPVTAPPVVDKEPVKPVASPTIASTYPRQLIGRRQGSIYLVNFPDQQRLVEDYSAGDLSAFSVCGFNIGYDLESNLGRPTGPDSADSGFATPDDVATPADMERRAFKDGRVIFLQKANTSSYITAFRDLTVPDTAEFPTMPNVAPTLTTVQHYELLSNHN